MSTRESIARPETELLRPASTAAQSVPRYARLLAWPLFHKFVSLGGDLFAITLAHMLAVRIVQLFLRIPMNALDSFEYHRFYIPFFAVILYLFDGYKSPELRRPDQELERSCKAVAVSFLGLVLINFVVFRSEVFSRYLLVSWFMLACLLLVAMRFTVRAFYEKLWKVGLCRRRAVLAGSPAGLSEYQEMLSIQRHRGYEVVGVLVDSTNPESLSTAVQHLPALGSLDQLEKSLAAVEANVLIVVSPPVPYGEGWLGEVLRRCQELRVDVELYSPILATANIYYEHDEVSGCFRFKVGPQRSLAVQRAVKRGIDVAIGFVGCVVTLVLTPILFLLVNLDERGPLFYRSSYLGQDRKTRYYLKFRTMHVDADRILETDAALRSRFSLQQKLLDDPRITKVGRYLRRYSLDEFPQFLAVFTGDLTFVGPRTIRQEESERYGSHLNKLLSVKPGVTGFWQVMGRQTTTYSERVQMDMFYVDRWSIWLDLVIIIKTFWKVLKAEGAY